jgi:dTDP-4-dehydrorhamnose reductase
LFTNEYRTPLHALDAARGLAELIALRRCPQILHLPGPERCSRWELGRRLCGLHQLDEVPLVPIECQDGLRPRDVSLCGTWQASRSLEEMLADA